MPIIDFLCTSCGPFEAYRPVTSSDLPPCPKCAGPSERHWITNQTRAQPDPVIVYRASDGSFRFPGSATGLYAQKCEREGMTRVELRGWADVRRFEGQVNATERSKIERRVERQQAALAQGEALRRSDFHHGLHHGLRVPTANGVKTVHLGPRARDIARLIMDRNNRKRTQSYEPGFRIEVYSENRSNREESRDSSGRRHRD